MEVQIEKIVAELLIKQLKTEKIRVLIIGRN
ncbi:hypothetical protein SAMN05446037_1006102 [Anaerovirgula multivorans]|uniref:Uncharacterized protein n=1 Tax=Anaerovirgula multivorans TaxID=312168 RepID=A0A239CRG8_9FIRM|nr:hypothetical protein SAMN05446037_1006102 [Anaerovirgula multivorans]